MLNANPSLLLKHKTQQLQSFCPVARSKATVCTPLHVAQGRPLHHKKDFSFPPDLCFSLCFIWQCDKNPYGYIKRNYKCARKNSNLFALLASDFLLVLKVNRCKGCGLTPLVNWLLVKYRFSESQCIGYQLESTTGLEVGDPKRFRFAPASATSAMRPWWAAPSLALHVFSWLGGSGNRFAPSWLSNVTYLFFVSFECPLLSKLCRLASRCRSCFLSLHQ